MTTENVVPLPSGHTEVFAIVGDPVAHSLSPALHSLAWARMGRDAVYVALPVTAEHLVRAVEGLHAAGVRGVNVTAPHKEDVQGACRELSEAAALAGSVNTLVRHADGWRGETTDGDGYVRWLEEIDVAVDGANVVLLGTGGAARSVALALLEAGAHSVRAVARDPARAVRTTRGVARVGGDRWSVVGLEEVYAGGTLAHGDVVISSLPPHALTPAMARLVLDRVAPQARIADMTYGAASTWLREAGARGHVVENGRGMLLHQAVLSAALWWGEAPPLELYRAALVAAGG